VARRADIYPGQIYRWRRELSGSLGGTGFAEVVVTAATNEKGVAPRIEMAIEVEFDGVGCLRIPSTPPELAAAVVRALRR
jgi:transposase